MYKCGMIAFFKPEKSLLFPEFSFQNIVLHDVSMKSYSMVISKFGKWHMLYPHLESS